MYVIVKQNLFLTISRAKILNTPMPAIFQVCNKIFCSFSLFFQRYMYLLLINRKEKVFLYLKQLSNYWNSNNHRHKQRFWTLLAVAIVLIRTRKFTYEVWSWSVWGKFPSVGFRQLLYNLWAQTRICYYRPRKRTLKSPVKISITESVQVKWIRLKRYILLSPSLRARAHAHSYTLIV